MSTPTHPQALSPDRLDEIRATVAYGPCLYCDHDLELMNHCDAQAARIKELEGEACDPDRHAALVAKGAADVALKCDRLQRELTEARRKLRQEYGGMLDEQEQLQRELEQVKAELAAEQKELCAEQAEALKQHTRADDALEVLRDVVEVMKWIADFDDQTVADWKSLRFDMRDKAQRILTDLRAELTALGVRHE